MATNKIEKASVGFSIARQGGGIVIDVRPNHDTIAAFRGVHVSFELLNGTTIEQARKILDVLNENVIGLAVSTASEVKTGSKTQAASS
jgi:hypothetical protein